MQLADRIRKKWFGFAIAAFLLAALFGVTLRLQFLVDLPVITYKYLLHAHSHVAMMGWGFTLVTGLLVFVFLKDLHSLTPYKRLFVINVVATIGMAVFFNYQGYGPISITFSTLHLVSAYWFASVFFKDLKKQPTTSASKFARWSVWWMLISTAGLWGIAPISMILDKAHPAYFSSIQFFLHFQFNGWFTYAVLALILWQSRIIIPGYIFTLFQFSLVLTYLLSIGWRLQEEWLFYLNAVGVVIQLIAYTFIIRRLISLKFLEQFIGPGRWLATFGIVSLMAKALLQVLLVSPHLANEAFGNRFWVIGLIHLIMLGFMTMTSLAVLIKNSVLKDQWGSRWGSGLLLTGFGGTEIILFLNGTTMTMGSYWSPILLFGLACLFPIGIGLTWSGLNASKNLAQ